MKMGMSIPVEIPKLADVMKRYRFAYLLTTPAHGAPHAVAVVPSLEDGVLVVDGVGRRTRENLLARPVVGLVWPPRDASDYSLIVDGHATLDGETLQISPTRAVLHRPASPAKPIEHEGCGSDCVELQTPSVVHPGATRT